MLKNHLHVAFRNLHRHPFYSTISIVSLVIGVTTCLLLLLYIQRERSYDRHIPEADRIYRIVTTMQSEGRAGQAAMTTAQLTPVLQQASPDLKVTRLYHWPYSDMLVQYGVQRFNESRFFRADSTFLEVFSLDMALGDPRTALRGPFSLLLTEAMAEKYFGDRDPLGEQVRVGDRGEYTVTGVVREASQPTHFRFDFLVFDGRGFPGGWEDELVWTYVKVPQQGNAETLARQLPLLVDRHFPEHLQDALALSLQPLLDIHLDAHLDGEIEAGGSRAHVYLFSAVALILLLIACINYVNLATAQAARRGREIGVRKATGASRRQLTVQLLIESSFVSLIAVAMSVILVVVLRPLVNATFGLALPADWLNGAWVGGLVALVLVVGSLAGGYPALYLSSLSPVRVLKGTLSRSGKEVVLREGLVVFQFASTLVLLIGAFVVHQQIRYMLAEERGIDRDNILMMTVPRAVALGWDWDLNVLRDEQLREPGILEASAIHVPWGRETEQYRLRAIGERGPSQLDADVLWVADDHYADLYGLTVQEGHTRLRPSTPDSVVAYELVLNETTAQRLGLVRPVGQEIELAFDGENWRRARVVGVVEDFFYRTLHHQVQPLLFVRGVGFSSVAVRIAPQDVTGTLARVAAVWERMGPNWPLDYFFLDDDYRQQYQAEEQVASLMRAFTVVAILIACLGLFGMAGFTTERRTKEIGVRKVLGASVSSIVVLLSKDFLKLVVVAIIVATPVSFFITRTWLEHFAYRTSLSVGVFALAGGLMLVIALLTVSYLTIRAALSDPVESLRYE